MVNYSKWDNLDSGDSDSDGGPPPRAEAQRRQLQAQGQQQQRNGGDDKRSLVQAELLRYDRLERGDSWFLVELLCSVDSLDNPPTRTSTYSCLVPGIPGSLCFAGRAPPQYQKYQYVRKCSDRVLSTRYSI